MDPTHATPPALRGWPRGAWTLLPLAAFAAFPTGVAILALGALLAPPAWLDA